MENYRTSQPVSGVASVDAGLRAHMLSIYNRMTAGVLVTGLVAFFVASSPALMSMIFGNQILAFAIMLSPLAVIWFGFNPNTMPASKLRVSFFILAVLYGLSFSTIFAVFQLGDIARAFFITAAGFAGLSIFGYTTKRDLGGVGKFAMMGTWGILALVLLNLFVQAPMLTNLISVGMLVAFAGITVWQTQAMKETYSPSYGEEANSRMGWVSALNLYLSFIAMFQAVLNLMNMARGE